MALYKLLHIFSAVIWIGGMFFVYVVLRPGIGQLLKLPERMRLWSRVFSRFFIWVWLAAFLLLASGFYMIYLQGGFAVMPRFINLMMAPGIAMLLVFAYLFFFCYAPFNLLVEQREWHQAEEVLVNILRLVAVDAALGLLAVVVAVAGRGM